MTFASDAIAIAPLLLSVGSACIAWTAIKTPQRDRGSKNDLDQSVLALESAYEALTDSGKTVRPVAPHRLNWLTAARHIEAYKALKVGVTEASHRTICDDHEEYWRHRFFLALDMYQIHDVGYYNGDKSTKKSELSVPSLIVVYGLASWPESKPDLLDGADLADILARHDVRKGNLGLERYIEKFAKWQTLFEEADSERRDKRQ